MAKLRTNGSKKAGIVKLKTAVEKLQKIGLLLAANNRNSKNNHDQYYGYEEEDFEGDFGNSHDSVPEDVKEGHFAVVAVDGNEEGSKRFVVPLSFLSHPTFVRLLERAAEEYGFDHGGAVAVPCRPSELERILAEGCESGDSSDDGASWGWFM